MANLNELSWHDVSGLELEGKGWSETAHRYDRLPARAKGVVREPVWNLSLNSAGLCLRFVTDSPAVAADWKLRSTNLAMDHMPATGVSGLDLYVRRGRAWHWLGVGRPTAQTNRTFLVNDMPRARREYVLYLPLYNGIDSLLIGLTAGAKLRNAPARARRAARPICFYGTSITNGGCASRPGMAYPAILGRRLNRSIVNLGFSGNGLMEPEMAALLAELDPSVYVLDPLPNLQPAQVAERIAHAVRTLRAARPKTPIVLVESITYQDGFLVESRRARYTGSNKALRELHRRLVAEGITGLHYAKGEGLLGPDGEATVDGTHPTDVGFLRIADLLEPVLKPLV